MLSINTAESFAAVATAITDRCTIKQFLPEPVAPATIAQLIDLAVWAPNHRLN
jgi:nitroreductase